jgi:uncharacterized membrane protein
MDYRLWALGSAIFAGITAVLAKKGVEGVPSNLALAVRVAVVLVFAVAIALITTFQGLVVAIPCVSIYGYLRIRVDALAGECAASAEEIVTIVERSGRKSGK